MRFSYDGKCSCGSSAYQIELSKQITEYTPRECDCGYCMARGIAYLSDPDGSIKLRSGHAFVTETQGSEQARFHLCHQCKSVLAVAIENGSNLIGAVNAALLSGGFKPGESATVSPRRLEPSEKLMRWQQIWSPLFIELD